MNTLLIDFQNFKKRLAEGIDIEHYILLVLAFQDSEKIPEIILDFKKKYLPLQTLGWVKILEDGIEIRQKGLDILEITDDINFDEFWDAFPVSTPSGRSLRAAHKEWTGNLTRDYVTCKKKYLSKVKKKHVHEVIVKTIKGRVASGDYEYMNNMETYINQRKWEVDFHKYYGKESTGTNSKLI